MSIVQKLLELSTDLLIVTDRGGDNYEIGNRFLAILDSKNVTSSEFGQMLRDAAPASGYKDTFTLPLGEFGIAASSFVALTHDSDRLVFIARDESAGIDFNLPKEQLEDIQLHEEEKNKRIHTLLDESSDPIFSFKEDGTYLYVNNCFAGTLGYKKEEIINRKIWDIFPKEEADKRFAMVQKVFLTGKTDTIEVKIPHPEGDVFF